MARRVSPAGPQPQPRTLTEALRMLSRDDLIGLLKARPDLCYPLPRDMAELATRAGTATSVARAVDQLNAWQRAVGEALAAQPDPGTVAATADLLGAPLPPVTAAIAVLRSRALLWGETDQVHLVRAVREYFEPYPGGLAAPSAQPMDGATIDQALDACGAGVRPVLDRLLWGPPTGAVRNADRVVRPDQAQTPIELLLAHRLLRPQDSDTVILPREVALRLRGNRLLGTEVAPQPPVLTGNSRNLEVIDRAAAGAGFGLLHDIELIVHALESTPHRLLRTGGLSTRDVNVLARDLGTDSAHATFVLEAAAATGLVAAGSNLCLMPTLDYDRWAARGPFDQWRAVATAWLAAPRQFSRSAEPGAHALGSEADAPSAPGVRRLILSEATAQPGLVVSLPELTAVVGWHRPRLAAGPTPLTTLVDWAWREAGWLGLTGMGAVSSFAALLDQPDAAAPAALLELFPAPVDKLIIQADLTAVSPGPLAHPVAAELRLLADQESRGGGGVFRFSAGSLRRAFDAGWSSADIHSWLEGHSTTGVPQPLGYLVDDLARQYGSVRVGPAGSYVRTEDDAQAAALLAAPEAATLGLRAVAPGLLIAAADPYEVVALLRKLGRSPAVEDELGRTLSAPPQLRATAARPSSKPATVSAEEAADAILARVRNPPAPKTTTEETLQFLDLAAKADMSVRISFVNSDGTPAVRELNPLGLGAGMVRAVDLSNAQVITIPLARISSVSPL